MRISGEVLVAEAGWYWLAWSVVEDEVTATGDRVVGWLVSGPTLVVPLLPGSKGPPRTGFTSGAVYRPDWRFASRTVTETVARPEGVTMTTAQRLLEEGGEG